MFATGPTSLKTRLLSSFLADLFTDCSYGCCRNSIKPRPAIPCHLIMRPCHVGNEPRRLGGPPSHIVNKPRSERRTKAIKARWDFTQLIDLHSPHTSPEAM